MNKEVKNIEVLLLPKPKVKVLTKEQAEKLKKLKAKMLRDKTEVLK